MTFKSIVWKMASGNHRKYMTYFLCNSFTVMFFFTFAVVYFNEQVVAGKEIQSLKYILAVPGVALIVFTVFFIQYAHDIFMKQRKSEFGLLASIGLSPRDIQKMVIIESAMISGLAVISGLVGGMVFSRFFFLLLMNAAGLGQVDAHLTWTMFVYPIGIYLFIYWFSVGISLYSMLQYTPNMKSDQMAETVNMKSLYFGMAGVFLLVLSIGGLYITYSPQSDVQELLYLWAFITFIGLYLCIANFTVLFTRMVKGMPSFYYRHVLLLSSIEYKMKRLSAIVTLVAVMVMVTLLYGTILLFTAKYEREQMIAFHPYDIAYMETETQNKLPASELEALMDDFDVQERISVPIFEYVEEDDSGWERAYSVISIDAFNAITGRQETLAENEFIYFINEEEAYAGDLANTTEFAFKTKTGELLAFNQKERYIERELSYLGNSSDYIVVSGTQFSQFEEWLAGQRAILHFMNVRDWEESGSLVAELKERLQSDQESNASDLERRELQVVSKIEVVEANAAETGILFFVTAFLSVLFFVGAFVLMYLNLFADIEKEKIKYKKLQQIGIMQKEVKRLVSAEMRILFFLPTFIGAVVTLLYLVSMGRDIGGLLANPHLLWYFFMLTGVYCMIQYLFYRYTRRKMVKELMS